MSTVQEIQLAISRLQAEDRMSLLDWIHSREEADFAADDPELFRLAKEGADQLDKGSGVFLEEARKLTSRWTTK